MYKVLCYGDSNTWGYTPDGNRLPEGARWPSVVQEILGSDYQIIENGLCGRTTCYDLEFGHCCNGKDGIGYAIYPTHPLDVVVIMLGINDLVVTDAEHSKEGIRELVRIVKNADANFPSSLPIFKNGPKILVIAPTPLSKDHDTNQESIYRGKYEDSLRFKKYYKEVADELGVDFLDAGEYTVASDEDGLHITTQSHTNLAKAVAEKVKEMVERV